MPQVLKTIFIFLFCFLVSFLLSARTGRNEQQGNYKEALIAKEKARKIADSISSINKAKEIASINAAYELETNRQIQELDQLSKRNAGQRNTIIIVASCLVLITIVLLFFYSKTVGLNKQLLKHEKELEELNSMKNKLFSVIGHDLRGPIARTIAILDLCESEDTSPEEKKFLFDSLKEHTKASLETFDKLLYWGQSLVKGVRINKVKMQPKGFITESIELRKIKAAEKNITISDNTPDNIYLLADPALFDFIIRNLVSNALKYTYRGGSIEISADTQSKPGYTTFAIKDTGVGMDEDARSHIFNSLVSLDGTENEKGHGIGLMLCKEFAVLNGGDIWVESDPGKGSTFFFSVKNAG